MFWVAGLASGVIAADDFVPRNSQRPGEEPPPAEETAAGIEVPEGFSVTLFAAEPHVRQPISMAFDDRGRLWVAESYSYGDWKREGQDRILVFTDRNGDGRFDERKVFLDGAHHLTSALPGFGGIWMIDLPSLWFVPDRDGDDVPDGPPEERLTGFTLDAQHNNANGLGWAPDGWLWGRHGITTDSAIGLPGSTEDERIHMSSGMWRYHPVDGRFERVFDGMTNPWGHDWDEHGHLFLSGNVNGHFWHGIPGAHYERMFGAGAFPHVYQRLAMMAERPHYPGPDDWRKAWNDDETGRAADSELGGGHSHCGAMIYLGTNWPPEFRGDIYMCNTHGRRVNRDSIEPGPDTFTSRYKGDVAVIRSPWFRGSGIVQAPDGSVLVSDWCDFGECHDDDGVHRTSGRIYGVRFGSPSPPEALRGGDLKRLSDPELVRLQDSENEWLVRAARRILQERSASRPLEDAAESLLRTRFADESATPRQRLRALWVLHSSGLAEQEDYLRALERKNPHEQSWALRLLADAQSAPGNALLGDGTIAGTLDGNAEVLDHPLARLYAAGLLARLGRDDARAIVGRLLAQDSGSVLETVTWHGLEPLVAADPAWAADLVGLSGSQRMRRFVARRIADGFSGLASQHGAVGDEVQAWSDAMIALLAGPSAVPEPGESVLAGILDALRGRRNLPSPGDPGRWSAALRRLWSEGGEEGDSESARVAAEIAVIFGDPEVIAELRATADDATRPAADRVRALRILTSIVPDDLRMLLERSYADPPLRLAAIEGFQSVADDGIARRILGDFPTLLPDERVAAVELLVAREATALLLANALAAGQVARTEISPSQAQRMTRFEDEDLRALLSEHWGAARASPAEKRRKIEEYRALLTSDRLGAPDLAAGQDIFRALCAACHRLFDEGGAIGPDLTGGGRRDLDYVLEHVVDPSASVPMDYWMSVVTLDDGRVLAGTIPEQSASILVLRTAAGEHRIDRETIVSVERTHASTMPEGLLDSLTADQVRDLVAYLALDRPPDRGNE